MQHKDIEDIGKIDERKFDGLKNIEITIKT